MAASKSKNTGHSGRNTKKKTAMEQEAILEQVVLWEMRSVISVSD